MSSQNKSSFISRLFNTSKTIYHKTPACMQWFFWPARLIYKYIRILRPDMWIVKGLEKSSSCELILTFAGSMVNKNYIVNLAFNSPDREDYLGKKWLWNIEKTAKAKNPNCSLIIAEVPYRLHVFTRKNRNSFYIPTWLSSRIDISSEDASLFKNKNNTLISDLRRIRRNKLHYEVTNELSQIKNFYYTMYVPYISKTHGNQTIIANFDFLIKDFKKRYKFNKLLLVKNKQEYIAGLVLGLNDKRRIIKLRLGGVKDGRIDYIKDGAIGSLYYFSYLYAREKGYKKIYFGDSRPFLKDGILRYKNKWKTTLYNNKDMDFLCKIISKSEGLKGFLLNNPFIYNSKTGLCAALFITNDCDFSKEELKKIHKDYFLKGLSKLNIFRFGKADSEIRETVPPEFSENITLSLTDNVFNNNK
jgi:hypothetical protein